MDTVASQGVSRRRLLITSAAMFGASACANLPLTGKRAENGPPSLRPGETTRTVFGQTLRDPYGWVDAVNLDETEISRFLRAHRLHAEQAMLTRESLVQSLLSRSDARAAGAAASRPVRHGAWRYRIGATEDGAWALLRRPLSGDQERLVLGAQPGEEVTMWGASEDGTFIAYAVRTGAEQGLIRVRDVSIGADLLDRVAGANVNIDLTRIVWAKDASGFFYTDIDETGRPWRALFHRLGTEQPSDKVLFQEPDKAFFVVVRQTSSGEFALIHSGSVTTSEVHFVSRAQPEEPPRLVRARAEGVEYAVDAASNTLLIATNDIHPNGRLVQASVAAPNVWSEVLAPNNEAGLVWHLAYERNWIVSERSDGVDRIRIIETETGVSQLVDFPVEVYTAGFDRWSAGPEVNSHADADELIIGYESFATPKSLLRFSFRTGQLVSDEPEASRVVNSADYVVERLFAQTADGARVPISLIRRGDRAPGAHLGLVLYGYGAYGNAVQATFDPARLALLDHNVMFALAHVRGGNDKGGIWAQAGQGANRDKPISDFIACAEHLTREGYVRRGRIIAEGHSAGAWLAASSVNLAPNLFAGALLHVPYLDVMTDLLTQQSVIAAIEVSVSDNPLTDQAAFERLLRIDPYRTLPRRGARPVLITGVLTDERVAWRGIAKFAARAAAAGADPIFVSLAESGSHWGPADQVLSQRWPHERYSFAIEILANKE